MAFAEKLDSYFGITAKGSNMKTEVKGGILVFLSMVYIIAVNSGMMVVAGIPYEEAYSATIIMAIIGSLLMGLYAKFPVAMAPGMGINAMFCYTAVLSLGFTWQEALVAVVIAGLGFFIVTVSGVRQKLLDKIPHALKASIIAGIGAFIAFIGLQNAGIITDSSTLVGLGDLSDPLVLLGFFCIVITLFLVARGNSLGVLIGMIATAVLGIVTGYIPLPSEIFSMPEAPPFGAFLDGISSDLVSVKFIAIVITFAFVEFFDGSGTLMAVGKRAGFTDQDDNVTCPSGRRGNRIPLRSDRLHAHNRLRGVGRRSRGRSKDRTRSRNRRHPLRILPVHRSSVPNRRVPMYRRCHVHRRSRHDGRA